MTNLSRTFSDRSNCRKAAMRALKEQPFKVHSVEGGFAYEALSMEAEDMPAPRFGESSPAIVDDIPPGLKRLRLAEEASEIRSATIEDQKTARAAAAARIAKTAPKAEAPKAEAPKAEAAPKAAKLAPKEGTTSRRVFDLLIRPEGATSKDMAEAGLKDISVAAYAKDFAKSFGLGLEIEKEGPVTRAKLIRG